MIRDVSGLGHLVLYGGCYMYQGVQYPSRLSRVGEPTCPFIECGQYFASLKGRSGVKRQLHPRPYRWLPK